MTLTFIDALECFFWLLFFASKKSNLTAGRVSRRNAKHSFAPANAVPLAARPGTNCNLKQLRPAALGIHASRSIRTSMYIKAAHYQDWIPAFAGMTENGISPCRGRDGRSYHGKEFRGIKNEYSG
ncbi:MAG: hypothetical protein ACRER0_07125 [Gammaproteobacteria bacterium]